MLSFGATLGVARLASQCENISTSRAVWLLLSIVWQQAVGELYPSLFRERERESFLFICIVQGQVTHGCAC